MSYTHTGEETATVSASADVLFDYLDDRARLGTYMEKPSMTMMGGRMIYQFDETKGRAVGSVITMHGSLLGIGLFVEEVVSHPGGKCGKPADGRVFRSSTLIEWDSRSCQLARVATCVSSSNTTFHQRWGDRFWAGCSRLCTQDGASGAWPRMQGASFNNRVATGARTSFNGMEHPHV